MKKDLWVKERGKDCYSPIDLDTNEVMVGLCIITQEPPGTVFGEYWFEKDGKLSIQFKGHGIYLSNSAEQLKMKTSWVVQSNLLNAKDHDSIKSICQKHATPFYSIKVIPFSNDLSDLSGIPTGAPTVFYGGTNFVTIVHESKKWSPGVFFNKETFTIRACMEHYKEHMLNHPCEFTTISKFASAHKSPDELFFIRPNKDLKEFSGDIFDFNRIVKWERALRHLPGVENNPRMTKDTEIIVSEPVGIAHEWRLFIVHGRASSGSHYRSGRKLEVNPDLPQRVIDFAEKMCTIWVPAPVFVMDIAESAGNLFVIECNCFNSSGFYDSDIEKIMMDIDQI